MGLNNREARSVAKLYREDWRENREQMDELDRWARGKLSEVDKPRLINPTKEYRELRDRSQTPWLGLIVTATAQSLYVEGYRTPDDNDNQPVWDVWKRNALKKRQIAVHRGALSLGLSYVSILPGELGGESIPKIRGISARRGVAYYADPVDDDWPIYFLEGETLRRSDNRLVDRLRLWDDERIHILEIGHSDSASDSATYLTSEEHGLGYVPIVRFDNLQDLDGRTMGEVEAYMTLAARIDQDTFDRLVVQRFNAWLLRWIAGMELPDEKVDPETGIASEDVDANRAFKAKLAAEDILVSEDPDTKFGAFPQASLQGYIESRDADIRDLAAVSQTPPHHLLGSIANLSAEALAAAEAGLSRKVAERKTGFGESWDQVLRTAAIMSGDEENFDADVRWRDTESRSLAQVADALGKLVQSLGIPPEALWDRAAEALGIPQSEVESWIQLRDEMDPLAGLMSQAMGGLDTPLPPETPPQGF